ncbi:hypothetical protein BH10BAC2_BH10BAC2_02640 [soil metagenome]
MTQPIRHDKRTKNKKSKAVQANIALHPFVTITIIAAIAIVVWLILFEGLRMM